MHITHISEKLVTVFNKEYAAQYDGLYVEKDYRNECDIIEKIIQLQANIGSNSILDIGCGTGGHAIEFIKRNYEVTGVDLSPYMLEIAKIKSESIGLQHKIRWVCGDIRDFNTGIKYDVCIMMFSVIGYLVSNEDILAGLRNVRKHLKLGGLIIFDFWSGPAVITSPATDRVKEIKRKDSTIIRMGKTSLNIEKQVADVTFKLWEWKNKSLLSTSEEMHSIRYFFTKEIELFLLSTGFKLKKISSFPDVKSPIDVYCWNGLAIGIAV